MLVTTCKMFWGGDYSARAVEDGWKISTMFENISNIIDFVDMGNARQDKKEKLRKLHAMQLRYQYSIMSS